MRIGVTAWSTHLPDLPPDTAFGGWAPEPACPPEEAATLLGRKGLLYKEPATRLALCAVHRALGRPPRSGAAGAGRRDPHSAPDVATAVVASSNLGNVATVCAVAGAVRREGVRGVSPLDAPNVSSNVIASTVAIWFGFGGPNLMVCSGHPSGLDAVALGASLLASGRACRVVVVGAEPDDPVATALLRADPAGGPPLRQAAACVVLEPTTTMVLDPVADAAPALMPRDWPETTIIAPAEVVLRGHPIDLTARIGHTYGALGVLQVAVAAALLAGRRGSARIVCGDETDGYRTTRLTSHGEAG
jgi:3-oxoacyl-[acyl-carrier-protein] synthase II